jgi:hypothetical protein
MTRMKNKRLKPQSLTPRQLAEEKYLMQFCHHAVLRVFHMLDREEAEAGLPDLYSHRVPRQRGRKKKAVKSPSVVKGKGNEK